MRWLFKFIFKWAFRLVLLIVVLVALVFLLKDSVLRVIAENRIRNETGLEVKIGRFSSGIFAPVVTIENLKIYNPPEFGGGLLLDIPELHLEVNRLALAERRLRLVLLRLNLAELDIVRNESGQTNIFSIADKLQVQGIKGGGAGGGGGGASKWLEGFQFDGIDVLNLTLGKAKFVDLKNPSRNREIDVNMRGQVFKNVKSEADLYGILFMAWLRSGGKLSMTPGDFGGRIEAGPPASSIK